jgi:hypothetical protein
MKDYWSGESLKVGLTANREIYISQVKNLSKNYIDIAKALRYVPGTKHIIYFSEGIYNSIYVYGMSQNEETRYALGGRSSAAREYYETMSKELAASNCPVFPVNTAGRRGDISLRHLANISGGKYFDNVVYYEDITEKINNLTSSYYILGYYIDEKWDGRYNKIKVKIKRKGCKVFGQSGYFNPKPFTEYTKLEKRLHLIDLALSEKPLLQEPLHFPLITLLFSVKDKPNIVAITKIPEEKIRDISGGRMEVVTCVFNKDNDIVKLQKSQSSASELTYKDIYFYSFLSLLPGEYDCRIVFRNLETGQGATASSSITIPAHTNSGFKLFPPLFLISEENARYLKGIEKDKKESQLLLSDIYHFNSTQYAPIVDELDRDTIKILAIVRCFIGNITEPEIQFSTHLRHLPSGEKVFFMPSFISQFRENENQIFFMEFPVGELQRGKYSLNIIAEELKTKSKSQIHSEIQVK